MLDRQQNIDGNPLTSCTRSSKSSGGGGDPNLANFAERDSSHAYESQLSETDRDCTAEVSLMDIHECSLTWNI